jgi:hypothetical protein
MKSRFQKKNLRKSRRQSLRRKIQRGGMTKEQAIYKLTNLGCTDAADVVNKYLYSSKAGEVPMPLFLLTLKVKQEKPNESWQGAAAEAGMKLMWGV